MLANTSTIDELIRNHNPFAGNIVVRTQQIWGKSFPDVPSINAHASDAVFNAIEKIRKGQGETVGITIASERGAGKSHIISRIRHRLQAQNDSLFIYMSKYDDLNIIKSQFLLSIASSLRAFGSKQVMQWQEIAAALINELKSWNYTAEYYISQYPAWLNKYSNELIEQFTKLIQPIKPQITNPYIIKAILWTLSPNHVNYASHWLSGLELDPKQAEFMGLVNHKNENREVEALNLVRQILDITSDYKIPIICFDELDNLEVSDSGFTTAQVIANLVKDMYNSLKKGIFVLTMYRETWEEQIKLLPQAEAVMDRLASNQVDRLPIRLNFLNSDDVVAITRQWLQDFYQEHKQTPPHPLYPFDEKQLRELGKERPTVRSVLKWCAENFSDPPPPKTKIESYYQQELAEVNEDIDEILEDEETISNALWLSFSSLIGQTIDEFTIESIEDIEPSAANNGFMDFKIIGKLVGRRRREKIGVDVVQQDGANIGAALKRLIDYETFNLTRGCLVRSNVIRPGATVAKEKLKLLLDRRKGGKWVALQSVDIQSLIAITWVYWGSENYGITGENEILEFQNQVLDFMDEKKIAVNNPLIREILKPPSYDHWIDNEFPIAIPQPMVNAE
ncbi:hypothetical protein [Nostoc sp. FACHB-110]|uniref:hypothetical protein n=1 Tax=Nostoc sp. FACHB-110 TaxID=2692834 RepID=UPI0016830618|nr:hypothetical protein [Nostoc sp. FACHB-110]MBD2436416.1 hypothetical protein [Nostoc sp. FACHB-110]